jgi:hypothetical protein
MNTKLRQWLILINPDLKTLFWISLCVFLFILFFQPFPLGNFDFNNRLLFIAGMGGIVFIFMLFTRTLFPNESHPVNDNNPQHPWPEFLSSSVLLALISLAFAFYIRYVGGTPITFFIMFKVVFIALVPPVALKLHDTFKALKQQNESLASNYQSYQEQIKKLKEDYLNKPIIFGSETSGDELELILSDVVFIKSADNYVEIVFKEGNHLVKKLLRNTLKNIEYQLQPYPNFIRCHRVCIVNTRYIHKLESKNHNYWISIEGYEDQIPVSRQYLLKVKENI